MSLEPAPAVSPELAPPEPPEGVPAVVRPRRPRLRAALRLLERSLACTGAVLLVWLACFDCAEMTSGSMAPTLVGDGAGSPGNDWLLYERISTRFMPPARSKLLVFSSEDGVTIAKRVVGFAGESLELHQGGRLIIDSVRSLDAPPGATWLRAGHLRPDPAGPQAYTVQADAAFVLGDDGRDSWDSRFTGGVPKQRWRGRALAIVWPPSRWRWLW